MRHGGQDKTSDALRSGLRDVHCHILPGVDDGSPDLATSKAMLDAAVQEGITEIVCTPHCRWDDFSFEAIARAFASLQPYAHEKGVKLVQAYEVYHRKLMELGIEVAPQLANPETNEFLLELSHRQKPLDLDRTIFELQGMGLTVTIAHPERYPFVQKDIDLVYDWKENGCQIQLSANFIDGGLFDKGKKTAKALLDAGLVDFIASDAHRVDHYDLFGACMSKYASQLS